MEKDKFDKFFTIWKSYEDVAMHFNDLIIKIRIQALGALVAFSTIVALLYEHQSITPKSIFFILLALTLAWVAIFLIDIKYYNRLLEGSVNAILEIEKTQIDDPDNIISHIILSTRIESAFNKKFDHEKKSFFKDVRCLFYLIIFLGLFVSTCTIGVIILLGYF